MRQFIRNSFNRLNVFSLFGIAIKGKRGLINGLQRHKRITQKQINEVSVQKKGSRMQEMKTQRTNNVRFLCVRGCQNGQL